MKLKDQILDRKHAAEGYLDNSGKRALWDEYESVFLGKLSDQLSDKTKSQVFDHKLSTFLLDREARVMSQIMTGKVRAISKNDEGASRLMNLILDKYVIPNANAQFDFLTKCRMVDRYSNIYGNYFVMVDWDIRKDGYNGPDMWLLPIRDIFPQVGAVSLEDSDYAIVRTWRPLSWFKDMASQDKSLKNMSKIIDKLEGKAGDKAARKQNDYSVREDDANAPEAKKAGYYEVLSQYEGDRWVDFVTAADMEMRDIKNPHDNGELPLVGKYSIPLIDDFFALGDIERGKSMQYSVNSLWNMYLDSVKASIFPPTLVNKDYIADMSSFKWSAAAKWLVKGAGGVDQAARTLNLTPQGTQTFNNVYQTVTSSLLNMMGTSDTSVSENVDPGFGKTPQALKMQAGRENARDNVDRFYMEQFLGKVSKKFVNLMSKKQSKALQIRMFEDEIEEMARVYPDIREMYDEESGKLTIKKSKTGSVLYDYEIVPGSTYAVDQKQQQENLIGLLGSLREGLAIGQDGKPTSPLIEAVRADGYEPKVGELFKRVLANSGITDWDKILTEKTPTDYTEEITRAFDQAMQQGINGIPP